MRLSAYSFPALPFAWVSFSLSLTYHSLIAAADSSVGKTFEFSSEKSMKRSIVIYQHVQWNNF